MSDDKKYFDLHTNGLGYINRIRIVRPKKGQPFLACVIAALRGESSGAERTVFDVKVTGSDAQKVVEGIEKQVAARKRVLIGFRIGDPWVDRFTYETDVVATYDGGQIKKGDVIHKKGDVGFMLKGRLLQVRWVKIDGQDVDLSQFGVESQEKAAA